jgi:hypothetical protein
MTFLVVDQEKKIMLKLASYGFIRYSLNLFPEGSYYFLPLILPLSVLGIIYSSFTTLRQIDFKKIIAYSSIGQIGPVNIICLLQQTICGEFKKLRGINIMSLISIFQNTKIVSNLILFLDSVLVRISIIYLNNPQITKALKFYYKISDNTPSTLMGISEAIRLLFTNIFNQYFNRIKIYVNSYLNFTSMYTTSTKNKNKANKKFFEWLAGLIDGDGYFYIAKTGSVSLEITMDLRDEHCLYLIKQKLGGSIKLKSGAKAVRYRLHHKEGIFNLINGINGYIRNPIRLDQLNKICIKYKIELIQPLPLTYDSGWLSGFFDSDGSIYMNKLNYTIVFSISQKYNYLFEPLVNLYGGKIYSHDKKKNTFR